MLGKIILQPNSNVWSTLSIVIFVTYYLCFRPMKKEGDSGNFTLLLSFQIFLWEWYLGFKESKKNKENNKFCRFYHRSV